MTHKTCGPECAIEFAQRERTARQRKESREQREKLKNRADWLAEAQTAFNAFIRYRDKDLPCISCGTYKDVQFAAGHYRSIGAAPHLRFNEDNVHKQCNKNCNMERGGNIVEYRLGLLAKIGQERLDALESDRSTAKWTIDDIKAIKEHYKMKLKQLKEVDVDGSQQCR